MFSSEKAFIMSFIAGLSKKGIKVINFDDFNYFKGIENMQQYFQENREKLGVFSSELAMLFLKNSNGDYFQFNRAIENLNVDMLSFDNPFYVTAHIKIDDNEADEVLKENSNYISMDFIEGFVSAYCMSAC